ncbi:hypothetical protein GCM10007898_22100 [Dyella flagellata]|uniref:Energy transducer TonB n=1 Tax=Dyella flagellata TaxID=1867833 RepID=A0ABQ5XAL3_9GAMM|nr:hypothetical protein GCM10007898_22100 [Dyella flagellata]
MVGKDSRGRFIERPDQVEHHRWFPPPEDDRHRGLAQLDGPTRAMLHELRWRKPPRDHRRLWMALTVALLLHVLFLLVMWYEMKPGLRVPQAVQVRLEEGIQVRFITRGAAKPQAAPPPVPAPPPRPIREPVSKNAMTVRMPESPAPAPQPAPAMSTPRPVLFDRTGQVVLPGSASSAAAVPPGDYVQRAPQGDTQIMQHRAGASYQSAPNAFKKYFPPPHESFLAGVMRKLNGHESNTKDVDLPGGIHLKCPKVLGIPTPNCVIPPPPPPSTDGDERLSMASAPLAKGAPVAKPDLAVCIADYRAGKPLPYGCPVDTPARAVDAEKKK